MNKQKYLVMVDPLHNNNKFYRLSQNSPTTFIAEYGRVGAKAMVRTYPIDQFEKKYDEKIRKGYTDVTDFHNPSGNTEVVYNIPDPDVRDFFITIEKYSSQVLTRNYTVSFQDVTPSMIQEAKYLISKLSEHNSFFINNNYLQELFVVIPRRMSNVSDFLQTRDTDINDIIAREYDLLDIMEARVKTTAAVQEKENILKNLGLNIIPVKDPKRIEEIKKHLTPESAHLFKRAFRVYNEKCDARFSECQKKYDKKDVHYLYHGSANRNWYGLITQGPLLHPKAVINGKMFGNGLYYAPRAKKSIGYTSLQGSVWTKGTCNQAYLGVFKVLFNNPKDVYRWSSSCKNFSKKTIFPHDAVFAHKSAGMLFNDEIIVYDEQQVTLQYVIELGI